jgi:hypothetical protein
MNWKNAIILLIIVILITPIFFMYLIDYFVVQMEVDEKGSWIGFMGNYIGGIMGAILAFSIASFQIKYEIRNRLEQKKEKEEYANKIVELFLSEEIKKNILMLEGNAEFDTGIKNSEKNKHIPFNLVCDWQFETKEFRSIREDLLKYDDKIISKVIDAYLMFTKLSNVSDISKLNQDDYGFVLRTYRFWKAFKVYGFKKL